MTSLTEALRIACRELVQQKLPHEAILFDQVWTAFWQAVGCKTIEDLEKAPQSNRDAVPIRVLGVVGSTGQELDTLLVLGLLSTAAAHLHRRSSSEALTSQNVADALTQELLRLETPPYLRRVLLEHGVSMLAGVMGIQIASSTPEPAIPAHYLQVEWYCPADDGGGEPDRGVDLLNPADVDGRFRSQSHRFELVVDELAPHILLPVIEKKVAWRDVQPGHKRFLGLVLSSLRTGQTIHHDTIVARVLKKSGRATPGDESNIRRTLSLLNKQLHHVLTGVLVAERGMHSYAIDRLIAYCWIRPGDGTSRLR